MKYFKYILFGFFGIACNSGMVENTFEKPIAKAYDANLYFSEIESLLTNYSGEDSVAVFKKIVEDWARKQAVFAQAKTQLANTFQMEKMAEEYKQSLIIEKYREALSLETTVEVASEDLKAYYDQYKQNFLAEQNWVNYKFIKYPSNTASIYSVLARVNESIKTAEIAEYCNQNNTECNLDDENWKLKSSLEEIFGNQSYLIKETDKFKLKTLSSGDFLLYKIEKIVNINEVLPLALVTEEVKQLVHVNNIQTEWETLEENLLSNAKNNNEIEILYK